MEREHQPRALVAHLAHTLEHQRDVLQLAHQVGGDDEVEGGAGNAERLGVGHLEREGRMVPLRDLHDLGRQVEAETSRRPQRGEQVAGAAAELQNRRVGGDDRPQRPLDVVVVEATFAIPRITRCGEAVVVIADSLFDGVGRGRPSGHGSRHCQGRIVARPFGRA